MSTTAPAATDRKSLMLDPVEYSKISAIAKKGNVARPTVIRALLASVDESRLMAALADLRAREAVESQEEKKKRAALGQLAAQLDMGQIEKLLAQMGVAAS